MGVGRWVGLKIWGVGPFLCRHLPEMRIPKKKFSFSRSPPVRTVTSVCTYVLAPPASVHVPSVPSPNAPPITIYHRIHVKKGPHPSIPTPKGRGQGWRQIGFKERSCRATLSTQSYCGAGKEKSTGNVSKNCELI